MQELSAFTIQYAYHNITFRALLNGTVPVLKEKIPHRVQGILVAVLFWQVWASKLFQEILIGYSCHHHAIELKLDLLRILTIHFICAVAGHQIPKTIFYDPSVPIFL